MFRKAFEKTLIHEGIYSNHPNDSGGETFRGITKRHHPDWEGWLIVDEIRLKNVENFEEILKKNYHLLLLAEKFYYDNYWNTSNLNLDKIGEIFPNTACQLFDIAVNMGPNTAGKILQRAINILNRDEKNYKNITVDGIIGPKTLDILTNEFQIERAYLPKLIILLRAKRYIDIVENNESQEVFIRGWLNRVSL